jgi:aspartate/methionine/tyrosine aminotransferase
MPERVITLGSLSKSHAMTGWRAGWLVGPPELARHVESLLMCMLFGSPGFVQEAAITALSIAPEAERRIRDYCDLRRARMIANLTGIPGISMVVPEAGMFMLIDVRDTGLSGYQFMKALYAAERVSVLDGAAFGSETVGFVRVCFATDEVSLDTACERMRRFCESL